MSRYARLMLHSVQGSCYGNKDEMKNCIREIEALEDTLCEMYATRMGKAKDEIRAMYFDGRDHWLRADEALALGLLTVFMTLTRCLRTVLPNRYSKYSITGCNSHKTRMT